MSDGSFEYCDGYSVNQIGCCQHRGGQNQLFKFQADETNTRYYVLLLYQVQCLIVRPRSTACVRNSVRLVSILLFFPKTYTWYSGVYFSIATLHDLILFFAQLCLF